MKLTRFTIRLIFGRSQVYEMKRSLEYILVLFVTMLACTLVMQAGLSHHIERDLLH